MLCFLALQCKTDGNLKVGANAVYAHPTFASGKQVGRLLYYFKKKILLHLFGEAAATQREYVGLYPKIRDSSSQSPLVSTFSTELDLSVKQKCILSL